MGPEKWCELEAAEPHTRKRCMNILGFRGYRMKIKLSIGILFLTLVSAALGATTTGLPFINDNYPKGLAEAKERKSPIFVEVWAPW